LALDANGFNGRAPIFALQDSTTMRFISLLIALIIAAYASYLIRYTVVNFNVPPSNETGLSITLGYAAVLAVGSLVIVLAALREYRKR
jgi:membrane carboxypeptidase/penicillin-binding protein PbpC